VKNLNKTIRRQERQLESIAIHTGIMETKVERLNAVMAEKDAAVQAMNEAKNKVEEANNNLEVLRTALEQERSLHQVTLHCANLLIY
jgi:hypothetical protein